MTAGEVNISSSPGDHRKFSQTGIFLSCQGAIPAPLRSYLSVIKAVSYQAKSHQNNETWPKAAGRGGGEDRKPKRVASQPPIEPRFSVGFIFSLRISLSLFSLGRILTETGPSACCIFSGKDRMCRAQLPPDYELVIHLQVGVSAIRLCKSESRNN